ncbi:MAG: DUF222 domain-containing protein [Leucobacter sp.]
MSTTFAPCAPSTVALDVVLTRLERVERDLRALEAERVDLLSAAFDIAAAETERRDSQVPSGSKAELALRAVRSEIAAMLRVGERSVLFQMEQAFTLTSAYEDTLETYRAGAISGQHAKVITDAGMVIGEGPGQVFRRQKYEAAVLEYAIVETPARLRPIAKRLAEEYAERTLEERHVEAKQRRRVWVEDRDEGMADLIAHLPAVEAHGIYNRLTSMSSEVEKAEVAAEREAKAAERNSETAEATAAQTASARRSRDEIRTDLLTDLLLRAGEDDSSACSGLCGSESETASEDVTEVYDATGLASIRAHVQVIIPGELITASDTDRPGAIPVAAPWFRRTAPDGPPEGVRDLTRDCACANSVGADGGVSAAITAATVTPAVDFSVEDARAFGAPDGPPAELVGYGPIDAMTARRLAGHADHWDLIRAAPAVAGAAGISAGTGGDLVIAVDRYRPSEEMRRHLGARDVHCRFPGCRVELARCDIDHTIDAALGGLTATDNLAYLCRGHHTLKHHSGWSVEQRAGGVLAWSSPTGRNYTEPPPSRVRFIPTGASTNAAGTMGVAAVPAVPPVPGLVGGRVPRSCTPPRSARPALPHCAPTSQPGRT